MNKQLSFEKGKEEDDHTNCTAHCHSGKHCLSRTFFFARTKVLCHKCGHGLHKGTWNEQNKTYHLIRNAISCGSFHTKGIDHGAENKERNIGKNLL